MQNCQEQIKYYLIYSTMSLDNGLSCVMKCDEGYSHVIVHITYTPTTPGVTFYVKGHKLPSGKKGFHVHQTGNLQDGCTTLGPHYNPTRVTHGGLNEPNAHRGDLGNIIVDKSGNCEMKIYSRYLTLSELLGRSLVIHTNQDDLGRGGNPESLKTGNSGSRMCCGVIGYA
uniref:Copper/zinc superoxide dismutase n=2 Tax=root TaxID=1 RepID=A0A481YY68_9VIRU|nr:MAG: copper/zinc superoxide dismutase [Marseillevirus LCMAC202]